MMRLSIDSLDSLIILITTHPLAMTFRHSITLLLLWLVPLDLLAQQDSVERHYTVDDVVVAAHQKAISTPDQAGNISISMDALKSLPHFAGAVDIVKLLQYTPGVAATPEGNTALYVRGGDTGQSRLYVNGAPLFAPSHLLGFFSVLNSAHLSGLTLYKSGIPAMYGSATSSITDIRTHSYVPHKFTAEGNIGLIESDLALQIPTSERFALFLSARHSYLVVLSTILNMEDVTLKYEFGDYGAGLVGDLGRAGRVIVNTHFNNDRLRANVATYNSDGNLKWWNALGTIALESKVGDRVTLKNMVYSSLYSNLLGLAITNQHFDVTAGVEAYGASSIATVDLEKIDISTGLNYEYRRVRPQNIIGPTTSVSPNLLERTSEAALFAEAKWEAHRHLIIDGGVRLSLFANNKTWCYAEPRLMISVPISSRLRFWASYNQMVQYLHLVPQSNMSFATDFYISSSEATPPQLSHNLSLGYNQSILSDRLNWTVELYYRQLQNVIEYDSRIFEILSGDANHHTLLYTGRGESYGAEFSINYSDNRFDLQLNYTLSKSLRQFDQINNGRAFYANSDRRHNLSLLGVWKPSPRWTLSATFIYATGAPYTATEGVYIGANVLLPQYGAYNGARLPDLHHLDLSATYWFKCRRLEDSGINISIYNVYAHKNPIMLSWDVYADSQGSIHIEEKYHTIYTIIPSISWTFKF